MDLVEDICTVDDLKRNPTSVFRKVHESRRPMVVTVDGKPEVILLSKELFASKKVALNAACELAELDAT
jgi:prevent-host-death family protein